MPSRKRVPTILFACLLLLAGCVSGGPAANESTTSAADTAAETTTSGWHQRLQNEYEPVPIRLENEWNRSVVMSLRVVRESTGETVYNESHDVSAGTDREVYSTAATDADEIESFRVILTARNTTERVSVETNACFGSVVGVISADGSVNLGFSIC